MKKQKKLWVVDLGKAVTKIAWGFPTTNGTLQVAGLVIEKTPKGLWPEDQPQKKPGLEAFLRPLLKEYQRQDEMMVIINHNEMIVVTVTFPKMTLQEIEAAIFWKIKLLITGNVEAWRIDFVAKEGIQRYEYLGIDAPKVAVCGVGIEKFRLSWYVKVFKKIGITLKSIVPQLYTLTSLIDQEINNSILIIDMAKTCTRFLYYNDGSLIENSCLALEPEWDGEMYLQQIIRAVDEIVQSPLRRAEGNKNIAIYLMGGESLHAGVLDYLNNGIGKNIWPIDLIWAERADIILPQLLTKSELCLITPCLCALIKWSQTKVAGGSP
ncbi:hypothetical protein [Acetobacterium woodii]|uniref:Type IV pilus assembly protein PilM n=1 Tax=Acetobacterium woodii (strain ATCC 29683 / DSM 1030 / JCM 2381 / KCTC 1655 / WB1) TaxID=931626 RepID=H6LEU3_ACEWD|nr:hypothetical protein [Acetobacterium woodii]AFA49386.1 hypothetical protein Awo_c26300 [Acetobacterium woodii DSM 1030]